MEEQCEKDYNSQLAMSAAHTAHKARKSGRPQTGRPLSMETLHNITHMNTDTFLKGYDSGAIRGIRLTSRSTKSRCGDCPMGKMKRASFSEKTEEFKREMNPADTKGRIKPGGLVYMDMVGPIKPLTYAMHECFYTFTDKATKAVWVYLVKRPREVYSCIRELNLTFSTHFDAQLRRLHTDQARAHTEREMGALKHEIGFETSYSAIYTPEQNQTAERTNGTVMAVARTILLASGLVKQYWGYAILYAACIINAAPRKILGYRSAIQALTGSPADWSRFRVFGCKTWVLIPKEQRKSKFDARAAVGIFVGFSQQTKAYLVRDPVTRIVYESPHCMFDESKHGGEPPFTNDSGMSEIQDAWSQSRFPSLPTGDDESFVREDMEGSSARDMRKRKARNVTFREESSSKEEAQDGGAGIKRARAENGGRARRRAQVPEVAVAPEEEDFGKGSDLSDVASDSSSDPGSGSGSDSDSDDRGKCEEDHDFVSHTITNKESGSTWKSLAQKWGTNFTHLKHINPDANQEWFQESSHGRTMKPRTGTQVNIPAMSACGRVLHWIVAVVNFRIDLGQHSNGVFAGGVMADDDMPSTFWHALQREDREQWQAAWEVEKNSMIRLGVLEQVDWPTNSKTNVCGSKLVCKIKRLADGSLDKYRVRWVAQGFSQQFGVDYFDTMSPVCTSATVKLVLAIACAVGCIAKQCDISAAYLRAQLDEVVYMSPPKGVEIPEIKGKKQCYRLRKSIYGLKQAGLNWYRKFTTETFSKSDGWSRCPLDNCLFVKREGMKFVIACVYVDDCIYVGNWDQEITKLERRITQLYDKTDFKEVEWFLGWKVDRDMKAGTLVLSQAQFIKDALNKFGLSDSTPLSIPCPTAHVFEELDPACLLDKKDQLIFVKSWYFLNYLATQTRADVAWVTSKLGMLHMSQADQHQMDAADRVFRYLKGTANHRELPIAKARIWNSKPTPMHPMPTTASATTADVDPRAGTSLCLLEEPFTGIADAKSQSHSVHAKQNMQHSVERDDLASPDARLPRFWV